MVLDAANEGWKSIKDFARALSDVRKLQSDKMRDHRRGLEGNLQKLEKDLTVGNEVAAVRSASELVREFEKESGAIMAEFKQQFEPLLASAQRSGERVRRYAAKSVELMLVESQTNLDSSVAFDAGEFNNNSRSQLDWFIRAVNDTSGASAGLMEPSKMLQADFDRIAQKVKAGQERESELESELKKIADGD